jgi:hypothetical protein
MVALTTSITASVDFPLPLVPNLLNGANPFQTREHNREPCASGSALLSLVAPPRAPAAQHCKSGENPTTHHTKSAPRLRRLLSSTLQRRATVSRHRVAKKFVRAQFKAPMGC